MICFKNFKYRLFPREKTSRVTEETLLHKETEALSSRHGTKQNPPGQLTMRSPNPKDRLVDQENRYDMNLVNQSQPIRKNMTPLVESNWNTNVQETKRSNIEKGDLQNEGKKRVGSSIGLDSQKMDSLQKFAQANFRSNDYKAIDDYKYKKTTFQ